MKFRKKEAKKIKNATQEELGKLQKEYEILVKDVREMSPAGLMMMALAGIVVVLYFRNNFIDVIGLILLLYPLYIFIGRGAHRAGYFEGYYEMMTRISSRDDGTDSDKPGQG